MGRQSNPMHMLVPTHVLPNLIAGNTYSPVHEKVKPDLPVLESLPHKPPLEVLSLCNLHRPLVGLRGRLPLILEAIDDKLALLLGQEACRLGEVVQEEEGGGRDDHGDNSLEDEDPAPALETANAVHLGDAESEEPAECTGNGSGREEHGLAELNFVAAIPHGQVVLGLSAWRFIVDRQGRPTATPGNRPASVRPRNNRATSRP